MIGIRGFYNQGRPKNLVVPDGLVITIDTTKPGTTNGIKLPFKSGMYSHDVYWGDGTMDTITTWDQPETTHIYSTNGIYDITIVGEISSQSFQFPLGIDGPKVIECSGELNCMYPFNMFQDCVNLTKFTSIFIGVEVTYRMFKNCVKLNEFTSSLIEIIGAGEMFMYCYDLHSIEQRRLDSLLNGEDMFSGTYLYNDVYDHLLNLMSSYNTSGIESGNLRLGMGNSKYSSFGASARNELVSRGWTITDGGPE